MSHPNITIIPGAVRTISPEEARSPRTVTGMLEYTNAEGMRKAVQVTFAHDDRPGISSTEWKRIYENLSPEVERDIQGGVIRGIALKDEYIPASLSYRARNMVAQSGGQGWSSSVTRLFSRPPSPGSSAPIPTPTSFEPFRTSRRILPINRHSNSSGEDFRVGDRVNARIPGYDGSLLQNPVVIRAFVMGDEGETLPLFSNSDNNNPKTRMWGTTNIDNLEHVGGNVRGTRARG